MCTYLIRNLGRRLQKHDNELTPKQGYTKMLKIIYTITSSKFTYTCIPDSATKASHVAGASSARETAVFYTVSYLYYYKLELCYVWNVTINERTFWQHIYIYRGHAYTLYPHNSRIDVRKFFFSERVIAPWNSLPATIEHFSSVSSSKYLINSIDFSIYISRSVFKF